MIDGESHNRFGHLSSCTCNTRLLPILQHEIISELCTRSTDIAYSLGVVSIGSIIEGRSGGPDTLTFGKTDL